MSEDSEEETIEELSCEYCKRCFSIDSAVCHRTNEGEAYEWACVGIITKPRRKKNIHDLINSIRLCITRKDGGITSHEWTHYEASCISMLLSEAVTYALRDGQPSPENIIELMKRGWKD